ncbi:A-kinase anchor protein 9-like isoform X4 [Stegodyphus dumicola]|uniref:A-kinase anchor protein 9-like isoform X4 n=1 Tax=Stegodyphus dumicola TaxID=202533 RepID=UPI0015B252E6|nr:A-kinase anchor protein 9-like isoform X4 [Stegodyphus dumicola]
MLQTNSRLLHVLSDLVKTFLDIENDINTHLLEHGLIPSRAGNLQQHDDETGQSVGSREDFTSLSLGECPNLELTEDGPDLTPRAWDLFSVVGTYDTEMEGEDVVLGASRRLRLAVDHVLNLLTRAIENQQNQDLKLLLKRNEELSQELQEESQGRDAVHMELVTAESLIRKLEVEKLKLEDLNREFKENEDLVKRELSIERNKVAHLEQEKETFLDEIHVLKEQCDLLMSRLGDPEKKLLQENSRLSSEKQTVQKNLSKERQSFLDRLHQMEIALDELNAEKEDLVEKKCKEIRDLKAEMEAMDKQLLSNRKFIEEQALEREQEREDFIKEINRMQEFVREKEKIQSNEAQLTKEIESLEQLLRARIEDHKNVMMKKDDLEKELRHSLDKIRDLRDIIEELEKQLDLKSKAETELRLKLSSMCETLNAKKEYNPKVEDAVNGFQTNYMSGDSTEQIDDLKERIASQSQEIETMSQSQTLLHELRGQIHFLEAKVEQRAKQLEAMNASLSSSPVQSSDTSPSSSQDTESLHIAYEDGFAMSPRSVHWLEIRRLEEKIGRLTQIDEDLIRKNKELERQLRELKISCSEYQHINAALQEKYHQQFMQTSALKLQINDQNHECGTPSKNNTPIEKFGQSEEYEKQLESNKRLLSELQEAQTCIHALQLEINQKDAVISSLQKTASELFKQQNFAEVGVTASVDEQPTCMELLLLEKKINR